MYALEQDIQRSTADDQESGKQRHLSFARSLGLFDATMLGLGVMLGAGVFVLVGVAASMAGPAAILAFALNAVVTMFTAYSYMELSSAIPEAGGGFSYISRAFRPWLGFIAGWMLWMAIVISCALFALGFGAYLWELFHLYLPAVFAWIELKFSSWQDGPAILLAVLICLGFVAINIKGADVTGKAENWLTIGKLFTLLVFVVGGALSISRHPQVTLDALQPFFTNGVSSVLMAMGVTFIAFGGYDLIAALSEEVRHPRKTIPRAIWLSFVISSIARVVIVLIAIVALPVIDGEPGWKMISGHGKTGLIKATELILHPGWVFIVALGGLMATTGALNAALLAASRVSYTMGRRRMLPAMFAVVHAGNRTPWVAILVSGTLCALFCVLLDVKSVGSAASVMFLLVYTLANLSLLAMRGRRDYKPLFRVPLYPLLPVLGVLSSLGLVLFQFIMPHTGLIDIAMILGWILLGLAAFFLYFRHRMQPEYLKVPLPEDESSFGRVPQPRFRIIVPFHNPRNVASLLRLAARIARPYGSDAEIVGVTVAAVPVQVEMHVDMAIIREQEPILHRAELAAAELGVRYRTELRVAHNTSRAITQFAQSQRADLLVLGWKGFETRSEAIFGSLIDEIIENAPCDLLLANIDSDLELPFRNVLLTTAGQENDMLAARLTASLIAEEGAGVTVSTVVKPGATEENLSRAAGRMEQTRTALGEDIRASVQVSLLRGRDIAREIIRAADSNGNDAIMVGARDEGWFRHVFVGLIPERVALLSERPVLLYKRHSGSRTILSRLLGDQHRPRRKMKKPRP